MQNVPCCSVLLSFFFFFIRILPPHLVHLSCYSKIFTRENNKTIIKPAFSIRIQPINVSAFTMNFYQTERKYFHIDLVEIKKKRQKKNEEEENPTETFYTSMVLIDRFFCYFLWMDFFSFFFFCV